jgi:hypothetical protein
MCLPLFRIATNDAGALGAIDCSGEDAEASSEGFFYHTLTAASLLLLPV